MIEIIPNWHPIFIHFTIALFSVSVGFYILAYIAAHLTTKLKSFTLEFEIIARWSLWIAAIITIVTVLTGLYAFNTVKHDTASHLAMITHRNWAIATALSIFFLFGWSIWRYFKKKPLTFAFIFCLLIVQGLLLSTMWRGAELVYRHGIGVMSLPKSEEEGHHHHYESADAKKPLYWVDPMEPTIHYEKSGKSRMGMELVPVYRQENSSMSQGIKISPEVINNLGVRTAVVKETDFQQKVTAYGTISAKEDNIMSISSHADGWIKKLYANEIGELFKKDQLLLEFYSPTAVQVQQQYLTLIKQQNRPDDVLFFRKKLKTLGISERQIDDIVNKRELQEVISIYAPENGVITELNVREGAQVKPEEVLLKITDLSTVWAILELFGEDALWLKKGQKVDLHLPDVSEKVWHAIIEYVYPEANPTLRTVKVRVSLPNPDGLLKPNMVINATIFSPSKKAITIPREALIYGTVKNHVIIALGQGRFAPREVMPGLETEDSVEILSGLKPGDNVVASGQFLIDSESNLKAALSRLKGP